MQEGTSKQADFIKSNLFTFGLLGIIATIAYWGTWNLFFQQDEWAGLGNYYALSGDLMSRLVEYYQPLFGRNLGHFLPFVPAVNFVRYSLFGLNYAPYAIASLLLHIVISYSVFRLVKLVTGKYQYSLFAALFFAICSSASQAVIWVGTSVPTQFATLFSAACVVNWLTWLSTQSKKNLYLTFGFLIAAIGFKETAVFLLVFLPLSYLLHGNKGNGRILYLFLLLGFGYTFLRFLVAGWERTLLLIVGSVGGVLLPFKGLGQILVPQELLLKISVEVTDLFGLGPRAGSINYALFVERVVAQSIFTGIGFFALLWGYFATKKTKAARNYLLFCVFFVLAFIPLALVPTPDGRYAFLTPRSLYLPLIAAAGLGAVALPVIKRSGTYLFLGLIILHIYALRVGIQSLARDAITRMKILRTIKETYPDLPSKAVFYVDSFSSYYGLPKEVKIVPFQSGFGQTLLVWYQSGEDWPKAFLTDSFLWEISAQGYKESDNRGFGYYRDKQLLARDLAEYDIPRNSLFAFQWMGEVAGLSDITQQLRAEIYEAN